MQTHAASTGTWHARALNVAQDGTQYLSSARRALWLAGSRRPQHLLPSAAARVQREERSWCRCSLPLGLALRTRGI